MQREAIKMLSSSHPNRSNSMNNLAVTLITWFEQSGQHKNLDEVISVP